jgi:NAD-dependent SIR2 family protein deacetylase
VIVAGTTATFAYIIDWVLRASHHGGALVEINPEETPLSRFATRLMREQPQKLCLSVRNPDYDPVMMLRCRSRRDVARHGR